MQYLCMSGLGLSLQVSHGYPRVLDGVPSDSTSLRLLTTFRNLRKGLSHQLGGICLKGIDPAGSRLSVIAVRFLAPGELSKYAELRRREFLACVSSRMLSSIRT